jgi:hypothetical protein
MPPNRTTGLQAAAQRKRQHALERARTTIHDLDRDGVDITFQAVARHAGVSRQWLYEQPELRREIERLRTLQHGRPSRVPARERGSEASLRQRVQTLLDENQRLRTENAALRDELALAYGHQRRQALGP